MITTIWRGNRPLRGFVVTADPHQALRFFRERRERLEERMQRPPVHSLARMCAAPVCSPRGVNPVNADADSPSIRLPQPDEIPEREKEDAMGAYLMMFASLAIGLPIPLVNLVASVIYFFVNRKNGRFVEFHSLQALLSHVPVVLLNAGLVGWLVGILVIPPHDSFTPAFFWFLLLVVLANITYIAWSIAALIHARKGRFFYMPLVGRMCFARCYGPKAETRRQARTWENRPPEGL
jgi:uncharacterized membrane protein